MTIPLEWVGVGFHTRLWSILSASSTNGCRKKLDGITRYSTGLQCLESKLLKMSEFLKSPKDPWLHPGDHISQSAVPRSH